MIKSSWKVCKRDEKSREKDLFSLIFQGVTLAYFFKRGGREGAGERIRGTGCLKGRIASQIT